MPSRHLGEVCEKMIDVTVNGMKKQFQEGTTVAAMLKSEGFTGGRVAVEINLDIVPQRMFEERELTSGDRIEIVSFVGGG